MTAFNDVEGQRARWRRALRHEALDITNREDFALLGLASRLHTPSVRLLLLPSDPDTDVIRFDDGFWEWVKNYEVVSIEGQNLRFGTQEASTAHAAVLLEGGHGRQEPWNSYFAVHRSGALEYGLGDHGAWERKDHEDNLVRVFNLISVVARTWALLKFGTVLRDRTAIDGPFQLTVAMHHTGGAFLGNVAQGWAEPLTIENNLPPCPDNRLLWHLELADWPDENGIQDLAFRVGDRLEDAWGLRQRRYLARTGALADRLDVHKLR